MTPWPARDEELTRLWGEGGSTRAIAETMGLSKNAVCGRAHRLGLPSRGSPIIRRDAPRPSQAISAAALAAIHPRAAAIIDGIAAGLTNGEIGQQIGLKHSRFSVVLRMLRDRGFVSPEIRRPKWRPVTMQAPLEHPVPAPKQPTSKRMAAPAYQPPPVGSAGKCQWPLWEPTEAISHRYCDAPTLAGHSWCEQHCARAFLPRKAA